MRLWTIHPKYLDPQGLVSLWREALLAQKVLMGGTRGYTRHPQLERFRAHHDPLAMISAFLHGVQSEADRRGYRFVRTKIAAQPFQGKVEESEGQLLFEWAHLKAKMERRSPKLHESLCLIEVPDPHPLFEIVPGEKRGWER